MSPDGQSEEERGNEKYIKKKTTTIVSHRFLRGFQWGDKTGLYIDFSCILGPVGFFSHHSDQEFTHKCLKQ